ncbi:hypothetical protein LCGC14_1488770 [marine sediment metagenome]|uniref:Uncharacterized protein n=1 Tax=marine sediment metagenome TaxID=412755 RepID=A0A0F9JT82_9ZZZZ
MGRKSLIEQAVEILHDKDQNLPVIDMDVWEALAVVATHTLQQDKVIIALEKRIIELEKYEA